VSLILEALRKLERDKDAPERGFVVMTHVPWAQGGSRSRLAGIGALALAIAMGALAVALWRGRARPAVPEGRAVVTTASPSPPPQAAPTVASPSPPFEAKALALESLRRTDAAVPGGPSAYASALPAAGPASRAGDVAPVAPRPQPTPTPELRLNAISRRDDKPVAILNDRLVREGDVFDGVRVIRIGETEVEVEIRGQRRVLTF
jgi:MSHA biogenesis protein MshK